MFRRIFALGAFLLVTACSDYSEELAQAPDPLGNFKLGHSEVVAPNLEKLLVSRDATPEEWISAVDEAVEARFRRFEGTAFYHFGISVEAYSLPPPVVPGKSAVAMRVTVWEDATGEKLNEETEVISVIKVFESRLANTREDQIRILAEDAAKQLELWLREQQQENQWFGAAADAAEVVEDAVAEQVDDAELIEPAEDTAS